MFNVSMPWNLNCTQISSSSKHLWMFLTNVLFAIYSLRLQTFQLLKKHEDSEEKIESKTLKYKTINRKLISIHFFYWMQIKILSLFLHSLKNRLSQENEATVKWNSMWPVIFSMNQGIIKSNLFISFCST